jgi:autotransporter-associated beta strand protein
MNPVLHSITLTPRQSALRHASVMAALTAYLLFGVGETRAQPDYPAAHWTPPGCTKWYTTGYGRSFIVIHDMEGYYWDSISYLNRCDTDTNGNYNVSASVHYLVNGLQNGSDGTHSENRPSDPPAGDITQSVREQYYAWHAVCLNRYSFGTEHEGFVSTPVWYSEAMYQASAALQRHLCTNYGIPMDRHHIVAHGEWQNPNWVLWMSNNYPQITVTCNNHTDPGIYWDWGRFMTLLSGTNYGMYWDRNGTTSGSGPTPNGVLDITSANWGTNSNGTIATGPWAGQVAIFSAGSDATGPYTITVDTVQTVNHLFVENGAVTFAGGQLNFTGLGTYYTNYIAAGCSATFNTPFGGSGSPDKWGPGLAVYNGASTCGGYFSLNQGTLALGNNSALSTTSLHVGEPIGANFVTLQSADATAHTLANNLLIYANSFSFGAGGNLTFTAGVNLGANTTSAKTIYVSNNVTTFSCIVSNTAGITKTGPGMLTLSVSTANTYGSPSANGNTTVSAGTLQLSKTAGVAAVANGNLMVNSTGTLRLGAADQIGIAIPLTLNGGTFQTAGFSEQLGTLKVSANSTIDLGAGAGILKFAASSGVVWTGGTVLTLSNWNGSISGGGAEQVVFGGNTSGLSASQVAQVRFVNPRGFSPGSYASVILASGEVVPLTFPPAITLQPADRTVIAGDTVSLNTSATGIPLPAYQWRFYGTNLPSATSPSLLLSNVTMSQAGSYSVLITNIAGSTNSQTAILAVYPSAAPTLNAPIFQATQFQFALTGVPGFKYAIWVSTNLTDWDPLQTNLSPFIFTDTTSALFPARYYRAQYVP